MSQGHFIARQLPYIEINEEIKHFMITDTILVLSMSWISIIINVVSCCIVPDVFESI